MQLYMQRFNESGLVFYFDSKWRVRKYDSQPFYRSLSGQGLKAVDFLALPDEGPVLLIEVKNYFNYHPNVNAPLQTTELPDPEELALRLHQKYHDTLRAIQVIRQFYQRRWWFRRVLPLTSYLSSYDLDWTFWTEAHQRAVEVGTSRLVCWVENEPNQDTWSAMVAHRLEALFVAADEVPDFQFASTRENPFWPKFQVKRQE
jgi:hypothetical protein